MKSFKKLMSESKGRVEVEQVIQLTPAKKPAVRVQPVCLCSVQPKTPAKEHTLLLSEQDLHMLEINMASQEFSDVDVSSIDAEVEAELL